jgi:enolase-phosphatase E1
VQAIVLDIEGTTTPIGFVYDVLFPFARRHLRAYLRDPGNEDALREPLQRLRDEWSDDVGALTGDGPPLAGHYVPGDAAPSAGLHGRDANARDASGHDLDEIQAYVEWLMDRDRKSPGLKLLQGRIWEEGYRRGELRGEIFGDVAAALRRWRAAGLAVAIYSSGSELAQRSLFASTVEGDLTPLIARFFDTAIGAKQATDSYRRIAAELGRPADRILFISDVTSELDAATGAGCQTLLCMRPGNHPQPPHEYRVIHSLEEVAP